LIQLTILAQLTLFWSHKAVVTKQCQMDVARMW